MDNQQPKSGLNSTQKTGFVLLLVFGMLTVGLGFLQMRNNIYNPFAIRLVETDQVASVLATNEEIRLQSIDTDKDGLNDWEELNFYNTSPYLPDTDSDNIDDKAEIDVGSDPLCPKGEDCGGADMANPTEAPDFVTPSDEILTPVDIFEDAGLAMSEEEFFNNIVLALDDPDKMRELLLTTGSITQEQLDAIDDNTLMKVANQIFAEQIKTATKEKINTTTTTAN